MAVQTGADYSVPTGTALLLHDAGIDTRNVLTRAGLAHDLFVRGPVWLAPDRYFALWRAIEDEADDPLLPIRLGDAFSVHAFDPLVFAATCSRNLAVAVDRMAVYKRLVGPMRLVIDRRVDEMSLGFVWPGAEPVPVTLAVSELAFVVALVRIATRVRVRPVRVSTPSPPRAGAAFRDYFGVAIERGATTSISFSIADVERPFLTVNDAMWDEFEPQLRARLADLDEGTSVTARVRASLLELLPTGEATVGSVARVLAMSQRSLQRRLGDEGTSFQIVLGDLRDSLARHYLRRGDLTNAEVAFLLGYENARSFIRAFVAWTGVTPGEARRRVGSVSNDRK